MKLILHLPHLFKDFSKGFNGFRLFEKSKGKKNVFFGIL